MTLRPKSEGGSRVYCLNAEETLYETRTRDLWQSAVVTRDGAKVGRVIRQVIEPETYTVRYLIVYSTQDERHIPIPSDTITDIDVTEHEVLCDIDTLRVQQLPDFTQVMPRTFEEEVYRTVERTPYWIEENQFFDGPELP